METSSSAAVSFRGVSKRYGTVTALDRISFTIAHGETVALLGPNGAGKSTAVDLMLGLRRPSGGEVTVLGGAAGRAVVGGRVGAMLQDGGLPSEAKVGEVVELARRLYGRSHTGTRSRAELLELAGLTALADRRTDVLSGGQRQRLRFAVAMAGRPELLFLDEPTVTMDVQGRQDFWAAVRAVAAAGAGVVFATHYLEEADAFADRVIVLTAGTVVADATPAALKARSSAAGGRTVRFTLPEADPARLLALPGVLDVTVHGDDVTLRTSDADATVGALYSGRLGVRDLEVTGAGLQDALLALTRSAR